jgi:TonB family protein
VWTTEDLGPAVCGVLRPRILAPRWLHALPASRRALVLRHEQEHIRAFDPALIAFARVVRILTPWNPAVWLLASRLVRAVELDCDRRVLRAGSDVAAYGETLIEVSARRPGRLVAVAAFAESHAPLRSRILAMTTPSRAVSIFALLSATVLGVVLLVGALQIPVPTVSFQINVAPAASTATARDVATPSGTPTQATPKPTPEPSTPSGAAQASSAAEPDLSRRPVFTPYTVAPHLLNRDQVLQALQAAYPGLLRDAGIGGTVRVFFFIDETGRVRETRVNGSSGQPALDQAALDVASVYRFSPALNRDQPVPVWVSLPITFRVP